MATSTQTPLSRHLRKVRAAHRAKRPATRHRSHVAGPKRRKPRHHSHSHKGSAHKRSRHPKSRRVSHLKHQAKGKHLRRGRRLRKLPKLQQTQTGHRRQVRSATAHARKSAHRTRRMANRTATVVHRRTHLHAHRNHHVAAHHKQRGRAKVKAWSTNHYGR